MLTVSENGYGKRTSAYEYRISGRGGKGIIAMTVNQRNGRLVGSFPVEEGDQIMLVTDRGQLIRVPVEGISIVGRSTQGVIVFDTAQDERVVAVEHIPDVENGNGHEGSADEGPADDEPLDDGPLDEEDQAKRANPSPRRCWWISASERAAGVSLANARKSRTSVRLRAECPRIPSRRSRATIRDRVSGLRPR